MEATNGMIVTRNGKSMVRICTEIRWPEYKAIIDYVRTQKTTVPEFANWAILSGLEVHKIATRMIEGYTEGLISLADMTGDEKRPIGEDAGLDCVASLKMPR